MEILKEQEVETNFNFSYETFTAIFKKYWKELYEIAYRRLEDEELAKDIVQDVFVYCWNQRASINIRESLASYLRTATQYQIVAYFRRESTKSKVYLKLSERMNYIEEQMNNLFSAQDLTFILNRELKKMPTTMQEIFKLKMQEHTTQEIAEILQVAEKTVRNNLSIGVNQLKEQLSKSYSKDYFAVLIFVYTI